jgi:hypothetical protein
MNVVAERAKIGGILPVHHDGLVATLEKVPPQVMSCVVPDRVDALEQAHPPREVGFGGFQQEMVVVAHQNVAMHNPATAPAGLPERLQKYLPIPVVAKNGLQAVPSVHHMIDGTAILNAHFSWHGSKAQGLCIYVNREELTRMART